MRRARSQAYGEGPVTGADPGALNLAQMTLGWMLARSLRREKRRDEGPGDNAAG